MSSYPEVVVAHLTSQRLCAVLSCHWSEIVRAMWICPPNLNCQWSYQSRKTCREGIFPFCLQETTGLILSHFQIGCQASVKCEPYLCGSVQWLSLTAPGLYTMSLNSSSSHPSQTLRKPSQCCLLPQTALIFSWPSLEIWYSQKSLYRPA